MPGYRPKRDRSDGDRLPPPVNPGPTSEPSMRTWGERGLPDPPVEHAPVTRRMSRDEQVRAAALAAAVEFVTVSTQTMTIAAAASKDGAAELEAMMGQVLGTLSIPGQARRFQRFIESGLWDE